MLEIQPLFSKPLAYTKIHLHESDIQIIKDLEYKSIEPDGFQSVDDMIWDRLPDVTRDIKRNVKDFNDNSTDMIVNFMIEFKPGTLKELLDKKKLTLDGVNEYFSKSKVKMRSLNDNILSDLKDVLNLLKKSK